MPNVTKVTAEGWLEAARKILIEQGIGGLKVDRLAKMLGVTRGGFYHNFKNHRDLLEQLLLHWKRTNSFVPDIGSLNSPKQALEVLERLPAIVILEEGYSTEYDLAIREWARIDPVANATVAEIDAARIEQLSKIFQALGYDSEEVEIRARVFYFHQIGYYALGYQRRDSAQERLVHAPAYLRILCGRLYAEAVEAESRKWI
jgi:AcrR family transcriptional regulator